MRPRLVAEFLATFALVLAGTGAMVVATQDPTAIDNLGVAIAFGLVVMTMIYAIGEVSGAHLNPAVTLAFAIARRFPWREVPLYVLAQCAGALVASLVVQGCIGSEDALGATHPKGAVGLAQAFGVEVLLSWLLMFVILGVATGAKEKGLMAGAAIGGTVGLCALFGGPLTGASMNPARSLGPALISGGHLDSLWVFLVAPCCGTALAVACLCLVQPTRCCDEPC